MVYEVSVDQAWEIARRVLQWKGVDDINENRSEGYIVAKSGKTLFYAVTMIGIWLEPIDRGETKVTAIAKSNTSVDTIIDLSENEFHDSCALYAP